MGPRAQEEIIADMNRALRGDEVGLVAYWTFDEAVGRKGSSPVPQVAFDRSAHNNHGILGGSLRADSKDPRWVPSGAPVVGGGGRESGAKK